MSINDTRNYGGLYFCHEPFHLSPTLFCRHSIHRALAHGQKLDHSPVLHTGHGVMLGEQMRPLCDSHALSSVVLLSTTRARFRFLSSCNLIHASLANLQPYGLDPLHTLHFNASRRAANSSSHEIFSPSILFFYLSDFTDMGNRPSADKRPGPAAK